MKIETKFDLGDPVFIEKGGSILPVTVTEIQIMIGNCYSESYLFPSLGGLVLDSTKVFSSRQEADKYIDWISK